MITSDIKSRVTLQRLWTSRSHCIVYPVCCNAIGMVAYWLSIDCPSTPFLCHILLFLYIFFLQSLPLCLNQQNLLSTAGFQDVTNHPSPPHLAEQIMKPLADAMPRSEKGTPNMKLCMLQMNLVSSYPGIANKLHLKATHQRTHQFNLISEFGKGLKLFER